MQRVETRMCIPLPMRKDIRYDPALAGGAMMDVGCYAIHQLRTLASAEPEVVSAEAKTISAGHRPLGKRRDGVRRRPNRQHRVRAALREAVQPGRARHR